MLPRLILAARQGLRQLVTDPCGLEQAHITEGGYWNCEKGLSSFWLICSMGGQPEPGLVGHSILRLGLGFISLLDKITWGFKGFSQTKMMVGACRGLLGLDAGTGVLFCLLDFLRVGTAGVSVCQGSEYTKKP